MRSASVLAGLALSIAVAAPVMAQEPLAARAAFGATKVSFQLPAGHFNATLSISGPNGRVISASTRQGSPVIDLSGQNAMGDGVYVWQLVAASPRTRAISADAANGRNALKANMRGEFLASVGAATSGTFLVKGGRIVDTSGQVEGKSR